MADQHPNPDSNGDTGVETGRGSPPGTPLWVKVFGIVAFVLVLLVVIIMFASGGSHGPGRHMPSGGAGDQTPPIAHGVQRP